jgi:hypothetical protein
MDDRTFIELLDQKIARLKVEYEQYFIKAVKREPAKLRAEVDRMVLEYGDKNISNTSLKFRLNGIVSRYNSYKQYWTRVLREIDEGTYVRKAEGADTGAPNGLKASPGPKVVPAPSKSDAREPAKPVEKAATDELQDVYRKYIEARKACGEPTSGVSFEAIAKTIEQNRKLVESKYNTKDLEIKVDVKDGKSRLVIAPKKAVKP